MKDAPTLIYDKSFIQTLGMEEARWLHHHYHVVIAPSLMVEVLSNLKKPDLKISGETHIGHITSKIPTHEISPTAFFKDIMRLELLGEDISLIRRPYMLHGEEVIDADGVKGVFLPESEETKAIRKWTAGKFDKDEHLASEVWQKFKQELDLTIFRKNPIWKNAFKHARTVEDVFQIVGANIEANQLLILEYLVNYAELTEAEGQAVFMEWTRLGRPHIARILPYCVHVMFVDLVFLGCMTKGIVSDERVSNMMDFTYFYYLPFANIFISNDKLHKKFAPYFLQTDQYFIKGETMSDELKKLSEYYRALPEDKKQGGTYRWARKPPEGQFITSMLYDKLMPYWRDHSSSESVKMTEEERKAFFKRIEPIMEHARKHHPIGDV